MGLKIAFIMDPLTSVKPHKDTSFFLMTAASERGHHLFALEHRGLRVRGDRLFAFMREVEVMDRPVDPFKVLSEETRDLSDMDVVFVRTDPPFDRRYLYTTLFLDLLPSSTLVINRPQGLRDCNEHLAALFFPDLGPRTLVTSDTDEILRMLSEVERLTLKPIDGHGGRGIRFLEPGQKDAAEQIRVMTGQGSQWIIAQEYVPRAREGDKRILLLDGEPLGAILRVHAPDQELNNLDAGGTAHPVALNSRDREICRRLKPFLVRHGLVFTGIDVLGDQLIEINVTSPTGLRELARFTGREVHHEILASVEDLSTRTKTRIPLNRSEGSVVS